MAFNLTSLGRRTDLIFARHNGVVEDRGEYLVIKTERNPGFYWGNYLLFDESPKATDYVRWKELFDKEFPYYAQPQHYVFAWQEQRLGEIDEFLAHDFVVDKGVVLTATSVKEPKRLHTSLQVMPIESDQQWSELLTLVVADNTEHEPESYLRFKRQQFLDYRIMQSQGIGQWFGAYIGGTLVGNCGVFFEDGIGRFQQVITFADYRNMGVCNTLVHRVCVWAFEQNKATTLVMEADVDYHAARIYEGLGFRASEHNFALTWW